jgi:hypothetical protein
MILEEKAATCRDILAPNEPASKTDLFSVPAYRFRRKSQSAYRSIPRFGGPQPEERASNSQCLTVNGHRDLNPDGILASHGYIFDDAGQATYFDPPALATLNAAL